MVVVVWKRKIVVVDFGEVKVVVVDMVLER